MIYIHAIKPILQTHACVSVSARLLLAQHMLSLSSAAVGRPATILIKRKHVHLIKVNESIVLLVLLAHIPTTQVGVTTVRTSAHTWRPSYDDEIDIIKL